MASKRATIWFDPKIDGYTIQCAFEIDFINFLKQSIPASDRSFDPASKTWRFHKKYLNAVTAAAKKYFGDHEVTVITEQQVAGAAAGAGGGKIGAASATQSTDAVLAEFMKLLPFDAANSAYRKASMLLHPDRGGSMDSMSRLNVLWDRIQKELYKQP